MDMHTCADACTNSKQGMRLRELQGNAHGATHGCTCLYVTVKWVE